MFQQRELLGEFRSIDIVIFNEHWAPDRLIQEDLKASSFEYPTDNSAGKPTLCFWLLHRRGQVNSIHDFCRHFDDTNFKRVERPFHDCFLLPKSPNTD